LFCLHLFWSPPSSNRYPLAFLISSHHFVDRRVRKTRASIGMSGSLKSTAEYCVRQPRGILALFLPSFSFGARQTGHQVIHVNDVPYAEPVLRADTPASLFQRSAVLTRLLKQNRSSPESNSRATLKARSVFV